MKKAGLVFVVLLLSVSSLFALDTTARVMGKVLTSDGEMLNAGIVIVDSQGNSHREVTNAFGGYVIYLEPGDYTLTFTKGTEFSEYSTSVSVEAMKTYYLKDVRLTQLFDSYALGWVGGDLHQHTIYSDGIDTVADLVVQNAAAGLYWGFLTDHDTSRGVAEWREASDSVTVFTDAEGSRRYFRGFAGDEVSSTFGHFQSLGTGMVFDKYEINLTEAEISSKDSKKISREKIIYIARQINRAGALAQMNHPYSSGNMGSMNYISVDDWEFFSYFDTIEIWNGYFTCPDGRFTNKTSANQNYTTKMLWYSILNKIKDGQPFIAATGGTDNHDSSGAATGKITAGFAKDPTTSEEYYNLCRYERKYNGYPTTYVRLDGAEVNMENVLAAVKAGHSFISNGPVVICMAGDKSYGDTVAAVGGKVTLTSDIFNRDGLELIRIVVNGQTARQIEVSGTTYTEDITVTGLKSGDWFLIEVLGDWNNYAITNPMFVK